MVNKVKIIEEISFCFNVLDFNGMTTNCWNVKSDFRNIVVTELKDRLLITSPGKKSIMIPMTNVACIRYEVEPVEEV